MNDYRLVQDTLEWALRHFKRLDESNAAIHTGSVRYSPITFRLAEAIAAHGIDEAAIGEYAEVLRHKGKYEEDKGR